MDRETAMGLAITVYVVVYVVVAVVVAVAQFLYAAYAYSRAMPVWKFNFATGCAMLGALAMMLV